MGSQHAFSHHKETSFPLPSEGVIAVATTGDRLESLNAVNKPYGPDINLPLTHTHTHTHTHTQTLVWSTTTDLTITMATDNAHLHTQRHKLTHTSLNTQGKILVSL